MTKDEALKHTLAVMEERRAKLWKMNMQNMNSEWGMGIMDQIRFEQIDALDKAIAAAKENT